MSQHHRDRLSGWNPAWRDEARGPNGKRLCMWCLTEVAGRRVTWCSDACVTAYRLENDWGYIKMTVRRRSGDVCAICSTAAEKYEYDHIIPLSEGGAYGIGNVRQLCRPCHQIETNKLTQRRKRRA